jgi:hypothetical protein
LSKLLDKRREDPPDLALLVPTELRRERMCMEHSFTPGEVSRR